MTKKQWLKEAREAFEEIEERFSCARFDRPATYLLGAQVMMLALKPASVSGEEAAALLTPFFDRAQAAVCTPESPCSMCIERARLNSEKAEKVGRYCKAANVEECRKQFGTQLGKVCATCPS